jgi:transposase InsO family protein
MNDARRQIENYIHYYNHERLHSALFYLTPKEVFDGKMDQRLKERQLNAIRLVEIEGIHP